MGREVALKRMLQALLSVHELVKRFLREVRAAAKLSHPNVVQVHDANEVERHLLPGDGVAGAASNLADYVLRQGRCP